MNRSQGSGVSPRRKAEQEILRKPSRQRHSPSELLGRGLIEPIFLAHYDLEPALAVLDDAEHLLVGAPGNERLEDLDRGVRDLGLAVDPVDAPGALLEHAGV